MTAKSNSDLKTATTCHTCHQSSYRVAHMMPYADCVIIKVGEATYEYTEKLSYSAVAYVCV